MPHIRAALWLFLSAAAIANAGAQNVTLKPLTPAELQAVNASIDKTLLPDGAGDIQVADTQSFHVQVAGHTELTLIPLRFSLSRPSLVKGIHRDANECGLYVVDASGKSRFNKVVDTNDAGLVQCGGIDAVGLARTSGPHPQIILIFRAHTVHRSWSDPYLVSWGDNDGRYVTEPLSTPCWAISTGKLTIAQARKWVDGHK